MLTMSRRGLLASAAVTAAFGLNAKIAFVNQVAKSKPLVLVLLGHGHHETKIGFGELFQRLRVARQGDLHRQELRPGGGRVEGAPTPLP